MNKGEEDEKYILIKNNRNNFKEIFYMYEWEKETFKIKENKELENLNNIYNKNKKNFDTYINLIDNLNAFKNNFIFFNEIVHEIITNVNDISEINLIIEKTETYG